MTGAAPAPRTDRRRSIRAGRWLKPSGDGRAIDERRAIDPHRQRTVLVVPAAVAGNCTWPLPSLIALTGNSRNGRGIGKSSITPLPPMHSIASTACREVRLQIQYLPTAVTRRTSAPS